ncbi:MAG: cadherin domain-containing protein, partial [Candidatus Saccharimonadaceae bacterium]
MKYKEDITLQNRIIIGPKFRFVLLTILLVIFYSTLLFSATIYIDPTNTSSGQNGSITNPYDSWTDFSFVNGNTYLQKRGTTYTSSSQIYISSKSNILIGAYNSGGRPKFSFTGSGYAFYIVSSSNCTVENFEVNGNSNAAALISIYGTTSSYTVNNIINNCLLYNAHSQGSGQGICGFYNDHLTILNTEIHNVAIDGIYLAYEPNIEIGYCNIYDVNRRYFSNPDQYYSSGDGIQLDGNYDGFRIHHTTIDRTNGAGNKYDLILNSAGSSQYASGIIEYCTFKTGPNVSSAVHIEMGDNIITRYNIFKGSTQGIKLGGNNTSNNLIHNNLFYDCKYGVGIAWGVTNTKVYNNVFYHVSSYHIWVDRTNVITRNNIHMRTTDAGVAIYNYGGGSWTISNNCYSSAAVSGTPGTGTNPIIGNPNFINPATGNFNIQSNSVVIDHGIPVGISFDMDNTAIFQGTAPEIGAFEYLTSSGSNLPPVINSQSFSINENTANGTTVGTVIASDPNSGQTLTYTITGGNTNNAFAINPSTGVLKVANSQSLNYESIPSFHLIVRVTDNGTGNLWAQSTISVNLININENPLISNQAFSVVQNSTNGTIVGTVAASDPDQSQILSYSITAGNANNTLTINTSTGVITVANSATLIQGSVILTVRATDNGSPILWSAAAITITVTSPPNQAPVIAAQSFSIVQNLPNGTLVGTIVASDPNAGQTLTYSITTGNTNTTFAINTTNGNLTIANSPALNPGIFLLTVRVTDNGNPGLFSQAIITVNVTTPANQAPVIAAQSFSIVQYSPNGSLVGTIVASDPNAGQTLIYSITAGNYNTIFAVNATNGNLTIANSPALNPGIFLLTVRVTDNGNPGLFSQAIITVNVTTPANQAPVIAAQSFSIVQYSPNGSLVGTIVASDPNAGQTLIYSITAGNYNTIFAVNATNGNLTIANSPALNPGIFLLTVRVTDNGNPGLFSQAIITV